MRKLVFLTCLLALGAPAALPAQEVINVATKAELPSGESILDKYIEATGGKEAYKNLKSLVIKGSLEIQGMGIKMDLTIYKAEPNLLLQEMTIPEMGKMQDGVDGKIAWSNNAMQGPSIKEGKEAEMAMLNAQFREDEWREKYTKAETLGTETVEGEECYKVLVTTKAGMPMTCYYSKNTGFLVRQDSKIESPMGELQIEAITKNYKKVGGIMMPHQAINRAMGQSMTMTFTDVKFNVDIPKTIFEPPAEVKALLK
jgi:outer membrane lipoprotein-sorting protein